MSTTWDLSSTSLQQSWRVGPSHMNKLLNFALPSMQEGNIMETSLSLLPLSLQPNYKRHATNSLNQQRYLCLKVHFDCWCVECLDDTVGEATPFHQ